MELLLSALQRPIVEGPSLEQCGIDQQWLLANYRQALEENKYETIEKLPPKAVKLFKAHFTNVSSAKAASSELFKHWHTDDYPEMSVAVSVDGKDLSIESKSQYPFMWPWFGSGQALGGHNCKISQVLAALLPKRFSNRERFLPGHGFRWDCTERVMDSIDDEWNLLNTKFKAGTDVDPIFARFKPIKSAISNLSSVDLDGAQAWNAELRSSNLPPNFVVGVSLRYSKGKLFGANEFLSNVTKYSDLVLSVSGLSQYIQSLPSDASIELRYVDGRSLSPKAQRDLAEDLRTHQKAALADLVLQKGAESAFIEVNGGSGGGSGCWSRALVFPSKEVLLWHFQCDSTPGFPADMLQTWDFYGWRSTGTLINADGKLAN